jgi:hypothetical protein
VHNDGCAGMKLLDSANDFKVQALLAIELVLEFRRRGETDDGLEIFKVEDFWLGDSLVFACGVLKQRGEGYDVDPVVIAQIAPDTDFVCGERPACERGVSPCKSEPLFDIRRIARSSAPHVFVDASKEALSLGVTRRFPDKVTKPLLGFNRAIETIGEQGELTFGPERGRRCGLAILGAA